MLDRRTEFAKLREVAGLSIEEAAMLLHVTERSIRRYETFGPRGSLPSPLAMSLMENPPRRRAPKLRTRVWATPEES